jgi:hypothetical protein
MRPGNLPRAQCWLWARSKNSSRFTAVTTASDARLLVLQQAYVDVGRGLLSCLSVRVCVGRHSQPWSNSAYWGCRSSVQENRPICLRSIRLREPLFLDPTHPLLRRIATSDEKAARNDLWCAQMQEPDSMDEPLLSQ